MNPNDLAGAGPTDGMDDMGPEPAPDAKPASAPAAEDCIPLSALAAADENEQLANPEVGDLVSYTVEGKVTKVDGKNAYVERKAVNGEPVKSDDAAAAPGDGSTPDAGGDSQDAADYQALQEMAKQQGGQ